MLKSDWSQFIPDLIISILVLFITGAVAYIKSAKFKNWLKNLLARFVLALKWIGGKWPLLVKVFILITLGGVIYLIYSDWKIIVLSIIFYLIGLLGWGLSNKNKLIPGQKRRTDVVKTKFLPMPIPAGIGNSYLRSRYINPPSGNIDLGEAQFHFEPNSLIFDTNENITYYLPLSDNGKQVDLQLHIPVNKVKAVYFLINSGNSKIEYENTSIGKIALIFKEAPPINVELILGQNIREWCLGNPGNYVRETTSSTIDRVWTGIGKNGANAVIDCLKIPIFDCMRECYLEKIVFVHKSIPQPPDTMGVHYSVFGISVEIEEFDYP